MRVIIGVFEGYMVGLFIRFMVGRVIICVYVEFWLVKLYINVLYFFVLLYYIYLVFINIFKLVKEVFRLCIIFIKFYEVRLEE